MPTTSRQRDHQPALHNCGPGPASVYRTAPVGSVHTLDLFAELHRASQLPAPVRAPFLPREVDLYDNLPSVTVIPAPPASPTAAGRLVAYLLRAIPEPGAPRPRRSRVPEPVIEYTEREVRVMLEQLKARLAAHQALVPCAGLASWVDRQRLPDKAPSLTTPWPWLPLDIEPHLRLAWLVLAISHAAPPLILFTRQPSLQYWRPDGTFSVRWLGIPEMNT